MDAGSDNKNDPSVNGVTRLLQHAGREQASAALLPLVYEELRKLAADRMRGERTDHTLQPKKMPLDVVDLATSEDPEQILAVDEAISRLEKQDPGAARVVRLRFYADLTVEETAKAMGISERTVMREWSFARIFLFRVLKDRDG
jgi:DNA-directed RNA polymerase specialized sigma24 family protein